MIKYDIDYQDKMFDVKSCRVSAEEGYPPAQYNLACFLSNENNGKQNWNEAIKWFGEAALQGYADAQYKLGACYELGQGVDKNEEMAFLWYREAAEQDNADAMHALGRCYANGIGVRKSKLQGIFWSDKATGQINKENDNPYSREEDNWEEYLFNATKNVDEIDEDEDEGYALGLELYHVAQWYETGLGVERDLVKAADLYLRLFDSGGKLGEMARRKIREYYGDGFLLDRLLEKIESSKESAAAVNRLGDCYKHGFGVDKDWEKAVQLYRKAAEAGNVAAQRSLGYCYECGEGVEQDFVQAAFWYRKGAEGGDPDAQVNLANCYFGGVGVENNDIQAVYWYEKAAWQEEHPVACRQLGYCYEIGRGIGQDMEKAASLYRMAAMKNDKEAQYSLGQLYFYGKGVKQDRAQAFFWFQKSASAGYSSAQNALSNYFCNS